MKLVLMPVICFIFLAEPASSETIGRLNPPQILRQIVSGAGLILLPLHRKKVRLEDSMVDFIYSPEKELIEEKPQIRSQKRDFPWEEYEALEQAFEQGQPLGIQELNRLMQLTMQIKQRELIQPVSSKNNPIKSYSVPGMRMAGGGCSKEAAVATATPTPTTEQTEPEFVSVTAQETTQGTLLSAQEINLGLRSQDSMQQAPEPPQTTVHRTSVDTTSSHEEPIEQTPSPKKKRQSLEFTSTFSRGNLPPDPAFGPLMEEGSATDSDE